MKRRTFLKLTGMSSASLALSGCQKSNEKLIPFLVAPEDGTVPGQADDYASVCRQCPAGCGILVRVSEGRAKKIEGNPLHPVNRGRLCARGQAALQDHYHPDRVRQPLQRDGERGSGRFAPISWDQALTLLTERMAGLRTAGQADRLALFTPPLTGSLATLVGRFRDGYGCRQHLAWDWLNTEWLRRVSQLSFGIDGVPDYDLAEAQYLLSFGADFLETHLSPVRYGQSFGAMRQLRPTVRGRFTYVGARLSLTAASADRWLPARPGTEGVLALGLARELLLRGVFDQAALQAAGLEASELLGQLSAYTPRAVSESTGVSPADLQATATDLATIRPALIMAGDAVAWQTNGLEAGSTIQLLNILVGSVGHTGGLHFSPPTAPGAGSSFADLRTFIRQMAAGRIDTLLVRGTDPAYSLPPALQFQAQLHKVPFLVSMTRVLDDTAQMADLVLPEHSDLESWDDVVPDRGVSQQVVGLQQPVVSPLHDSRSFPDVLLALARRLGGEVQRSCPWENYPALLRESMRQRLGNPAEAAFQQEWLGLQQQGGLFEATPPANARPPGGTFRLPSQLGSSFAGAAEAFPLFLQLYLSPFFTDGRGAHLPWLQQLPDPMTTTVWDVWVEINPVTAQQLGIVHGDLVEVTSMAGTIELPAVVYPGIRPEVVAIPIGQGHRAGGRYAAGRRVNPLQLLADIHDERHSLPAWGATRVQLRRLSATGHLVAAGHAEGSYRRDILGL
ncbi:MAG: molybdopterin-dependent oxidoreductase [Desulfuromonadales bacterium]|nr:molybdopterin-dependent oxidoreductase [Desulfuromonadales bacterium]